MTDKELLQQALEANERLGKRVNELTEAFEFAARRAREQRTGIFFELDKEASCLFGAAAEREACAQVCEEVGEHPSLTPRHCAEAIRARGSND